MRLRAAVSSWAGREKNGVRPSQKKSGASERHVADKPWDAPLIEKTPTTVRELDSF